MATATVERTSAPRNLEGEFEEPVTTSLPNSTSTVVAMVACNVILLVMLAACSPPAHATDLAPALVVAIPIERLVVTPPNEDRAAPVKNRWQRFDESLNAGRRIRGFAF